MDSTINIFWFRRDLRLIDNAGLYHALSDSQPLLPVFIFDRNILDQLHEKSDRRLQFIHNALCEMQDKLITMGSSMEIYYDFPENVFRLLSKKYRIGKVFTNHDYDPFALERDKLINKLLGESGISFHSFKDHVIFDRNEVLKDDQSPYTIFTPYSKRWKTLVNEFYLKSYPTKKYYANFYKQPILKIPSMGEIGFKQLDETFPSKKIADSRFGNYQQQRDFPFEEGTSRLGVHLRFGTISIRELASRAFALSEVFLNELIGRDFYHMILWHFPAIARGNSLKPEYDHIKWRNHESEFEKWCQGMTGYPIVDAGMRQLNATGYMHNRVRMITASFLSKHLLIDWRWGEAYFAEKLLDFDLAANNGGWQWAASCGCDAAPYFRIFNPSLQTKKFDPDLKYVRKWVPELEEFGYPEPIVDHEFARKRALETYGKVFKNRSAYQ